MYDHSPTKLATLLITKVTVVLLIQAVAVKVAALEGAEAALVLSSGMAAISSTLLTLLKTGEHLLIQGAAYGGTYDFVHSDLPPLGVEATMIDTQEPDSWSKHLRPNTKVQILTVMYLVHVTNNKNLLPLFLCLLIVTTSLPHRAVLGSLASCCIRICHVELVICC